MRAVVFVIPGAIETRTGGYAYDRKIAAGLRALGWAVEIRPAVDADLAAIGDGRIVLIDGLALLAIGDAIVEAAARLRIVPLVHLPLALEPGLDAVEAGRRHAIERRVLASAAAIIVTGRIAKDLLEGDGVPGDRIAIVEPGTDAAPLARGSGGNGVALLSVGALTAGKGHELLVRALGAVPSAEWTLTCAGSLERDPATVGRVRELVGALTLGDRVKLAGELDDEQLASEYDRADVFVLATLRETYGMAVAEAIAHGLPVVSTTVGAIPDVVGGGGLLVPLTTKAPSPRRCRGSSATRRFGMR